MRTSDRQVLLGVRHSQIILTLAISESNPKRRLKVVRQSLITRNDDGYVGNPVAKLLLQAADLVICSRQKTSIKR